MVGERAAVLSGIHVSRKCTEIDTDAACLFGQGPGCRGQDRRVAVSVDGDFNGDVLTSTKGIFDCSRVAFDHAVAEDQRIGGPLVEHIGPFAGQTVDHHQTKRRAIGGIGRNLPDRGCPVVIRVNCRERARDCRDANIPGPGLAYRAVKHGADDLGRIVFAGDRDGDGLKRFRALRIGQRGGIGFGDLDAFAKTVGQPFVKRIGPFPADRVNDHGAN